ncbi:alpha/beta fold hydrolase [Protofrankia symbiont of Coriaria ruscifolia]|uniref:alpha/beta fold hydrolase n=1 Tax=Protofrankia symbiont of Coriaria ruscifolia TaxID=1306542 RepID=UPI00104146D2|nr:alpha/beta hydrolase [Protofrankia symbiont of Coriaria ruscifolia]
MPTLTSYDGTPISYRLLGSGPPLLVVPGGPRASEYLGDLGGLAADVTLIRFDARGTGDSGLPADEASYAYPRLADDVEAVRRQLGLDRVAVLGHSAGAAVAQAYASTYPDRVERLILVTPGPQYVGADGADLPAILAARSAEPWYPEVTAAFGELFALGPDADPATVLGMLARVAPAGYGAWGPAQRDHAAKAPSQFGLAAWAGFDRTDEGPAILARLATVTSPVLVVTGALDAMAGVAVGDVVAGVFPDARHVTLAGAGHYPWVDEPAAFAATVRSFLHLPEPRRETAAPTAAPSAAPTAVPVAGRRRGPAV